MKNLVLALVVALAFCTAATAHEIAISTQANWWSQAAADREIQDIVDNVTGISIELFTVDEQDALADWITAHTGDGEPDILILTGRFPASIYPAGNAEPDGSLAELFLDDGNTIINTGDYMFYVTSSGSNNETGGLQNMMDIANGAIDMWDDNTPVSVTNEGRAVAPSLQDIQSDRPFHLDALEGDWVPELVFAQNDAGTRADPVIVVNTVTGGRLGIFYQIADTDTELRGDVISEWINNYVLTDGAIPNTSAWKPNPANGTIDSTAGSLEWTAGYGAVMHRVYLSTDETIDDADLLGEIDIEVQPVALDPGVTYYWRIDEVAADDSVVEGDVWSFSTLPLEAHFPFPADGATNLISLDELIWTAGKDAVFHNAYFGTDPDALAPILQMQMVTTVAAPAIDPDTTYYWRVDEVTPTGTVTGLVWSFSTLGQVTLPDEIPADLAAWYPLTEDASSRAALDMSGNDHHGELVGALAFVDDPDMGQVLSLPGGDNQYVNIGSVGISGNMPRTIMCWAKADHTSIPDWTLVFGFTGDVDGNGGSGSHFNIGSLGGPGGVGAHVWGWEETIFSDQDALDWRHYTMTYDGTTIGYYGDGQSLDTDPGKSNVRDLSLSADRVHIGSRVTQASSFPGKVSDARIYNRVLTDAEIRQIGGDVSLPWNPVPADGASGQTSDTVLSWDPGDFAVEQDVYLGLDAAAVADANASDTTGIYQGRQTDTTYTPVLSSGATHYWRVDQVDADGNVAIGPVWSFTTALQIPAEANLGACKSNTPGFLIYSFKPQDSTGWGYNGLLEILDTGLLNGVGATEEGTRIDEFVNLRDTGNGEFSEANGYPDAAFPGIDPDEVPAQDPAAGDDDDYFGTEILGCIHLHEGLHRIGADSDDGTIVWIGGIEIGRTGEWKGASIVDFPAFEVLENGYYTLRAVNMEGGGGASVELHEILADGTRLLLNDVANGGSSVYIPAEPLLSVVRSGGVSGDRDPVGAYDGSTAPLATEPGGLKDGNTVFSDRTYPWAGIPAEYEGSEYIRTYNSDKNGGTVDVKYEVTISRDAILWVTIDDRIPDEWNADGAIASQQDAADYVTAQIGPAGTFTDSGIDIFVREKDDGSRDRPMSVFVAELPAGTYTFTSMDSGKNFYSIGAIE